MARGGGAGWPGLKAIMLASAIPKSPSSRTLSLSVAWRGMAWHGTDGTLAFGGPFLPRDRLNDLLILILPPCGVDRGFAAQPTSHGQLHLHQGSVNASYGSGALSFHAWSASPLRAVGNSSIQLLYYSLLLFCLPDE